MAGNAFERNENPEDTTPTPGRDPFSDERPLFSEDDLPMFEQIQRALPEEGVDDAVGSVLKEMPPDDKQLEGIKRNVEKLEQDGLWATARFYKRLLEKREAQEG